MRQTTLFAYSFRLGQKAEDRYAMRKAPLEAKATERRRGERFPQVRVGLNTGGEVFIRASGRPSIEIETVRQLHEHQPRRPIHHSCQVALAGQIIGDKSLPCSASPLLIVAGADFDRT